MVGLSFEFVFQHDSIIFAYSSGHELGILGRRFSEIIFCFRTLSGYLYSLNGALFMQFAISQHTIPKLYMSAFSSYPEREEGSITSGANHWKVGNSSFN